MDFVQYLYNYWVKDAEVFHCRYLLHLNIHFYQRFISDNQMTDSIFYFTIVPHLWGRPVQACTPL